MLTVPVALREVSFERASRPPIAARCFSMTSSAVACADVRAAAGIRNEDTRSMEKRTGSIRLVMITTVSHAVQFVHTGRYLQSEYFRYIFASLRRAVHPHVREHIDEKSQKPSTQGPGPQ